MLKKFRQVVKKELGNGHFTEINIDKRGLVNCAIFSTNLSSWKIFHTQKNRNVVEFLSLEDDANFSAKLG